MAKSREVYGEEEDSAISNTIMEQQQTEKIKWADKVATDLETTDLGARCSSTVVSQAALINDPLITGEECSPYSSLAVDQQNFAHLNLKGNLGVAYDSSSQSDSESEVDDVVDHCLLDQLGDQQTSNNIEKITTRPKSLRRKKSFKRVRQLFEPPSELAVPLRQHSLPAFHRHQLGRPLSVNLPLTSTNNHSPPLAAEMSPVLSTVNFFSSRRRSNDDLLGPNIDDNNNNFTVNPAKRQQSPVTKLLSTSSISIINDLFIIPTKTVYENVRFFESKVQQSSGNRTAVAQTYSSSRSTKGDELQAVPQHEKLRATKAVEVQQRMRSSATSADDILQQHEQQQIKMQTSVSMATKQKTSEEHKEEHEPSIRDLFYHRFNQVNGKDSKQQVSKSAPHLQMQTQQPNMSKHPQSVACQTEQVEEVQNSVMSSSSNDQNNSSPVEVYIHIDNGNASILPSHNRASKSTKPSKSRYSSRHRLRSSRNHGFVNVQISKPLVTSSSTTASCQQPPTEYRLQLSPSALSKFTSKLHRFCEQHSTTSQQMTANLMDERGTQMKDDFELDSVSSFANDDEDDNSIRKESPIPVNLMHRDSIATGFSSSPRWKDRRKAVYRRNLSLNEYLTRALQQEGTTMLTFGTSYPWRSFIQSGRQANRLNGLKTEEVHLYESLFEIILTERTNLRHLGELSNFAESVPSLKTAISAYDRQLLFGSAAQLHATTKALFDELEAAFTLDIFMGGTCPILTNYLSTGRLEGYIDFIKGTDERNRLLSEKGSKFLTQSESTRLNSLLITPMQRVTRYPLLVKNVLDQVDKLTVKLPSAKLPDRNLIEQCYTTATLFAVRCNQALNDERNLYDLVCFKKQIAGGLQIPDLVSTSRQIVMQCTVKVQRRISLKMVTSSGRPVEHSTAKDIRLKANLVLLTDMIILAEIKWRK